MKHIIFFICIFLLVSTDSFAQVTKEYNLVWTSQSKNASESMPCGGGDIGMNVWVEKGELLIYAAKSGSLNADNAMMKAGRIRIKLSPNVFEGTIFKQQLHLQEGWI